MSYRMHCGYDSVEPEPLHSSHTSAPAIVTSPIYGADSTLAFGAEHDIPFFIIWT